MTPADVIALFATPETLMRRCYLHIAGGATRSPSLPDAPAPPANGQAHIHTFKIEIGHQTADGFTTGLSGLFRRRKDRPFVKVTKLVGAAKAVLAADEMNAYYVPMVQTSDVGAGASHYSLPTAGMPDVMITSKLSGCRFGVGSDALGALLVSHVQPDASVGTATRQQDLTTNLTGGFNAVTGTFGMGGAYDAMAAVIGKRTGVAWKFYCQASSYSNSSYSIDGTTTIG